MWWGGAAGKERGKVGGGGGGSLTVFYWSSKEANLLYRYINKAAMTFAIFFCHVIFLSLVILCVSKKKQPKTPDIQSRFSIEIVEHHMLILCTG